MVWSRTDTGALDHRVARPGPCAVRPGRGNTCAMGFNPERQHRRSPWDIVFVASALVVAAGLVIWALLG